MCLETAILCEASQTQKDKYISYMWGEKVTKALIYKTDRCRKQTNGYQEMGGHKLGDRTDMYTLLYINS